MDGEIEFRGETDRSFHYICKDSDVCYWLNADIPVLLVCSHPPNGQAWWMPLQPWFSDPAHRASRRIESGSTGCATTGTCTPLATRTSRR